MPGLLALMFLPWTPPPQKPAMAWNTQVHAVDLFAEIKITDPRRMPKVKMLTIGGMPVALVPK